MIVFIKIGLTALTNHIGDVALLIVIAWILNFGIWNYIYYLVSISNWFEIIVITFYSGFGSNDLKKLSLMIVPRYCDFLLLNKWNSWREKLHIVLWRN